MITVSDRLRAAGRRLLDAADADPRYGHTGALYVVHDGEVVTDEHRRGPRTAPVFSITKSLMATTLAALDHRGLLPPLDTPLSAALPALADTPAAAHTWHHVLTMTRGAQVGPPFDADTLAELPDGLVEHIGRAPQVSAPGARFAYDDAAPHLLSAAVGALTDRALADWARELVFDPIGVGPVIWPADPQGVSWGPTGVEISAADLARVGGLWLTGGVHGGVRLLGERFWAAMTTPHSPGGPPEGHPYGFGLWLPPQGLLAGGWAGQHLLVLPRTRTVIVTTGDPGFDPGPPPSDSLPTDWRPALDLVEQHLLPVLDR